MSRGLGEQQRWAIRWLRTNLTDDRRVHRLRIARLRRLSPGGDYREFMEGEVAMFVSLREICEARFGVEPKASQVESMRRSLQRLNASEWIVAETLAGELLVTGVDRNVDPDERGAIRAMDFTEPDLDQVRALEARDRRLYES